MIRFVLKEASLLIAFIVLGSILLLCLWLTSSVKQQVFKEFQNTHLSLILKSDQREDLVRFLDTESTVVRYEFFSPSQNKKRLGELYPELRNVMGSLEQKFFPNSAAVVVTDAAKFTARLEAKGLKKDIEAQTIHHPPVRLQRFLQVLTGVFSALWLLTLALVLYFNLERLTLREEPRWSLMKMLGAKPSRLFWPLWASQASRVALASVFAVALSFLAIEQIRSFFAWNWHRLSGSVWIGFILTSLLLTSLISLFMFSLKYRRVALG